MYNYRRGKPPNHSWLFMSFRCMLLIHLLGCRDTDAALTDARIECSEPVENLGGIPNLGATCYLNATMQVIAKLYPTIFENSDTDLAKQGQTIVNKIKQDKQNVTTREAEDFFNALRVTNWNKEPSSQEDPTEVFIHILEYLKVPPFFTKMVFPYYMPLTLNYGDTPNKLQDKIDTLSNIQLNDQLTIFPLVVERAQYDDQQSDVKKNSSPIEDILSFTLKATNQVKTVAIDPQNVNYQLVAFLAHVNSESASSGHYIAYIKINGKWKHYDDSTVSTVTNEAAEEAAKRAYFYFFRRAS